VSVKNSVELFITPMSSSKSRRSSGGDDSGGTRTSSRTTVVSKAMRVVDEETRREIREKRIVMLEADNFMDDQDAGGDDEAYADESDDSREGGGGGSGNKKKKARTSLGRQSTGQVFRAKWTIKRVKQFGRIVYEHGLSAEPPPLLSRAFDFDQLGGTPCVFPNYLSACASPSSLPSRHFCSVCGQPGRYSCGRCGMRSCSTACTEHHKETRCLKVGY